MKMRFGKNSQSRLSRLFTVAARLAFVALAMVAVWRLLALVIHSPRFNRPEIATIVERVMLPAATLLLLGMVMVRHEWKWNRKLRTLRQLLPQIISGERSIEELSELKTDDDEVGKLIPQLQQLLHELRQQRQKLTMQDEEIRQRVAHRTDALERTVGTLRQQATRDALTGLGNRRALDLMLPRLIETCRAQSKDLCLLMIDVDNFKTLNDTLGHSAGDQFLRDIGGLIRSTIRAGDLPFRLGGDEFVILMPEAQIQAADSLANRLEAIASAHAKSLKVQPQPGLSIGTGRLNALTIFTAGALLEAADQKLYAVKRERKAAA